MGGGSFFHASTAHGLWQKIVRQLAQNKLLASVDVSECRLRSPLKQTADTVLHPGFQKQKPLI